MPPLRNDRSSLALALALVAFLSATASVASAFVENTWIFRDGRFYVNVTTTLVEHLSLEQHPFAASWYTGTLGWNRDLDPGWSNVALGRNGEHWPKHPYILPILASPLYFALGLPATLLFNLLVFGAIVAGLYRFARAYAEPLPAALAAVVFVFATIIVGSAYDYSTDVLMLGLFALALAAVKERRGAIAGVLVGLAVIIKPTALMLLPSLVLLFFERTEPKGGRPDPARTRRALGRALASGTLVLGLFALANTWMYGRPYWSGYNRTLVTVAGAPSVASHADAFSVPFDVGLERVLFGDYGLVAAFAVLALALPGLLVLLRRRPRAALAGLLALALSLTVFARYIYEGHRFHWPALALLVPALAASFAWLGARSPRGVERGPRRLRVPDEALVALAAFAVTLFVGGGAAPARLGASPWAEQTLALLERLMPAELAAIACVVASALAAAALVASLFSLSAGPAALRAAALLAPFGVPEVRAGLAEGGPALHAVALLTLALALLARPLSERALREVPPARWALACAAFALAIAAALEPGGAARGVALGRELALALGTRGPARAILPFAPLALLGALMTASSLVTRSGERDGPPLARSRAFALLVLAPSLFVASSTLGSSLVPSIAMAVLVASALSLPALRALAGVLGRLASSPKARALTLVGVLAGCLVVGLARRAEAGARPFSIASEEAVRSAVVFLEEPGIGEVPCDFLAWEHLSWECATFDRGVHNEVGLAVDEPLRVGGESAPSFLLPAGSRGERRRVVFPSVRAGSVLTLRWAIPDGQRGTGTLVVRVDDRERARIALPAQPTGAFEALQIETPDVGDRARLELELVDAGGPSVVLLRGGY